MGKSILLSIIIIAWDIHFIYRVCHVTYQCKNNAYSIHHNVHNTLNRQVLVIFVIMGEYYSIDSLVMAMWIYNILFTVWTVSQTKDGM